jgi:hypothetical protein
MNRFEQRLKRHLEDADFAAGFYEMSEELRLMVAQYVIAESEANPSNESKQIDFVAESPDKS